MTNLLSQPGSSKPGQSRTSATDSNIITAAKGGGITFVGQLFAYATSFIFSITVARMLGAEQFGLYNLALTASGLAAGLSYLGLNGGLSRYIPIFRSEGNPAKIWGVIQIGTSIPFLISLILSTIFWITAEPVSIIFFKEPALTPVLRIAIISIPIIILTSSAELITQGFKQLQYQVYAMDLAFSIVKLILAIILLVLGLGVIGVISAYVVSWVISLVMLVYFAHRLFPLNRSISSAQRNVGEMFRFSLPLYFSRLLSAFSGSFETLALGFFGIVADVGVYAAILRLSQIGNMFFSSLRKISVPVISELYSQGKYDELERFYQTTTKWSVAFNLPIFLTISLFATSLLTIFGDDFTSGATGLVILAGATLFNAATGTCGTVINMTGHSKLALLNSLVYLGTTIILDIVLIPRFQLVGAAWAGALTIVINNTLRLIEVYYIVPGLLPFNLSFLKPIIAGLLAVSGTYLLMGFTLVNWPLMQLIVLAPVLWLIYVGIILALKLSDEDRMILDKLQGRLKLFNRKSS